VQDAAILAVDTFLYRSHAENKTAPANTRGSARGVLEAAIADGRTVLRSSTPAQRTSLERDAAAKRDKASLTDWAKMSHLSVPLSICPAGSGFDLTGRVRNAQNKHLPPPRVA
jgi:hypothetical protein